MVLGGITSSCSSDAVTHSLDLSGSATEWTHANPTSFVRRRGAEAAWIDNGSADGVITVVGGVADTYVCCRSSTVVELTIATASYTYPAADVLSIPLGATSLVSTKNLPGSLTGSELAVSDFAFTRGTDGTLYMIGGQAANGDSVSLNYIGKYTTSSGWVSQATTGDVPVGRVGASLVAHPSLDLLVLHGGNVNNAATSTLAFLNTTSWAWSTPSNLQPPASSAASYHSSIMTPQGVMITAFGLGSTGSPSTNVFYLDMRDPTQSTWSWKSYWNKDMLETYQSTTTGNTNTTGTNIASDATSGGDKKKTTSIVVPVIIAALILIPLAVWFIRRRVRIAKKRRLARHFSFSSQEDEGDFRTALDQYHSPSRRTKTQYGFGRDANEKDGNILTDLAGAFKRFSARRRSGSESSSSIGEREMVQVESPPRVTRLDEKAMRWENIDFGLGKVDERAQSSEARRGSGVASTAVDPFADPAPLIRFDSVEDDSPRMGTPLHDGQQALVPELNILPPTPAAPGAGLGPAFQPSSSDGLDWSMLAQEMHMKPAFRSISPTSTLRSHAHPLPPIPVNAPSAQPTSTVALVSPIKPDTDTDNAYDGYTSAPAGPIARPASFHQSSGVVPRLPSLDFQRNSLNLDPAIRRSSTPSPRAVSQPIQAGRQLAGGNRRDSVPYIATPSSSGSVTPTPRSPQFDVQARRASNPAVIPLPRSPLSPGSPGTFGVPASRDSLGLGIGTVGNREKRHSALSQLRVMNMTEEDESSVETGHAV